MKIVFLGTAGYHPSETRHTTSIIIPELGFVLDAGTGFFRARDLIRGDHLDIFLSHAHLDHLQGVTYLLDVLWGKNIPNENVTIWGEKTHLDYLEKHIFGSPVFPVPFLYRTKEVSRKFTVKGVRVQTKVLPHPGNSIGYRFTFPDGRVLAYVTDTVAEGAQLPLIENADLLIHECNFPDTFMGSSLSTEEHAKKTGHSITSKVNALALEAKVKRLALIHFNPLDPREDPTDQANARIKFPGVIVAHDLMELEF